MLIILKMRRFLTIHRVIFCSNGVLTNVERFIGLLDQQTAKKLPVSIKFAKNKAIQYSIFIKAAQKYLPMYAYAETKHRGTEPRIATYRFQSLNSVFRKKLQGNSVPCDKSLAIRKNIFGNGRLCFLVKDGIFFRVEQLVLDFF